MSEPKIVAECWTCRFSPRYSSMYAIPLTQAELSEHEGHDVRSVTQDKEGEK